MKYEGDVNRFWPVSDGVVISMDGKPFDPVRILLGIEAWPCQTDFGWNWKIRPILGYFGQAELYNKKYFKYLVFPGNFW